MIKGCNFFNQIWVIVAILLLHCTGKELNAFTPTTIDRDSTVQPVIAYDTLPIGIWDKIDLTGPQMKPSPKKNNWWLYTLGAGVLGGGAYWYFNRDKDTTEFPDDYRFILNDDLINIVCGVEDRSIDPLTNDIGTGLSIVEISNNESVTLEGSTIFIDKFISENVEISVKIKDAKGNEKTSILKIIVDFLPFTIESKFHTIENDDEVKDNIFSTSPCEGCTIIDVTGNHNTGSFTIEESGEYTYIPNELFKGLAQFRVEVENECKQTTTILIEIDVKGDDCFINPKVNIQNILCGLSTGQIEIILAPIERYRVVWEDGLIAFNRINLSAGSYRFTIFDLFGDCQEDYIVSIPEESFDFVRDIETHPSNCLKEGEIFLHFAQINHTYNISIYKEGEFINKFNFVGPTLNVGNYFNISSGRYTFVISLVGREEFCTVEIEAIVNFEDLPLNAEDDWITVDYNTIGEGDILINDSGTGIALYSYEQPVYGTVSVDQNGKTIYTPLLNFNGIDSFLYVIRDTCEQLDTAIVRISVQDKCDFEGIVVTKDADCGFSNGTASIVIQPDSLTYQIMWSNGQVGWSTINLNPGHYYVVVQEIASECRMSFPFEIKGSETPILKHYEVEAGSCYESGNIALFFNENYSPPYDIDIRLNGEYIGDLTLFGDTHLKEIMYVRPGNYTLTLNSTIDGCTQEISFEVDENETKIDLQNDSIKIKINHEWSGNILDNDTGVSLKIDSYEQPDGGNVDIDENGEATFKPHQDFEGITRFLYTAIDTCGQLDTAFVVIEVYNHCQHELRATVRDAICGLNNGIAEISIDPENIPFEILWSNGRTERKIDNLMAGIYFVTLTTEDGCKYVDSIEINERPLELITNIDSSPADCVGGGNIWGNFNATYPGPYMLSLFLEDSLIGAFEFTGNTFNFQDSLNLKRGQYTVLVNSLDFHPQCIQTLEVNIMQIPSVSILLPDYYTTPNNEILVRNVLNNDVGYNLILQSITPPVYGNILYQPNGFFTFTPYNGFSGVDTLIYSTIDICGQQNSAQIFITVTDPGPEIEDNSSIFVSFPNRMDDKTDTKPSGAMMENWMLLFTSKGYGLRIDNTPSFSKLNGFTGNTYNISVGHFSRSNKNWYLLPGISLGTDLFKTNSGNLDFKGIHTQAGIMFKLVQGIHFDINTKLETDFSKLRLTPSIRLLNEFKFNSKLDKAIPKLHTFN